MARYLLLYHGGTPMGNTTSDEQKATMQAWADWFKTVGAGIVDVGNPVSRQWTLSKQGTTDDGGANPSGGYSVIEAESLQKALEMTVGCPHLAGGGTIELCETFNIG